MEFHEHASIFPMMTEAEFRGLVEDIREHGLRDPIVMLDGKILDGRNRWNACQELSIEPKTIEFDNGAPIAFIISHNLHRRHLNSSQRAMIAAELATRTPAQAAKLASDYATGKRLSSVDPIGSTEPPTQPQAAQMLNVGKSSLVRAKKILKEGTPAEIEAIKGGKISVDTVHKRIIAGEDKNRRNAVLEQSPHSNRTKSLQANAQLWGFLKDALIGLTSLPNAEDMVRIARGNPHTKRITEEKPSYAFTYLEEFYNVWNRG